MKYIAEYIKYLGFDGIAYNSSLNESGINIAIFNYKKCDAIGSKLHEVSDICFETKAVLPQEEKGLMHHKLQHHNKTQQILQTLNKINT